MSVNIKAPATALPYTRPRFGETPRGAAADASGPGAGSAPDRAGTTQNASVGAPPARNAGETKGKRTASAAEVTKAMEEANKRLAADNVGVRFRLFEDRVQIQVFDATRERVIRSVPSDEMIRLASRMRELSGVGALVDQSL